MPFLLLLLVFILNGCAPARTYYPYPQPVPSEIAYRPPIALPPPIKKAPLIVIDPGHGGQDAGTKSLTKPFYQEKSLTLSTARMVRDYLKQFGYDTEMTRNEDVFIPLVDRAQKANEAEPALFVSVHYNSAPSREANGIEVFFYLSEEDAKRTKSSKNLAAVILDEVIQSTQAKSRGVKKGNYAVIRETKMPAVLVEAGFLTNQDEMAKIKDPVYMKKIALGIAKGIDRYLKSNK